MRFMNRRLLLASKSPRRQELLRQHGVDFTVVTAETPEISSAPEPRRVPEINALRKAEQVGKLYPAAVVIGADTVILYRDEIIGKPRDLAEAAAILHKLAGNVHEVITAVAICCAELRLKRQFAVTTRVQFKAVSAAVIDQYLQAVPVLDKAGAYAIQDHGELLIQQIDGDRENVIGLPTGRLLLELNHLNL